MEWHEDRAKLEWYTQSVGDFWSIQVLASWSAAPWDPDHPHRWGVILRGPTTPLGPYREADIWAAWGTAATQEEAREKALNKAEALIKALPKAWRVYTGEMPF